MNTIKIKAIVLVLLFGMTLYGCSSNNNSSDQQNTKEEHAGHNHEAEKEEDVHNEALHAIKEELAENEILITGKQMKSAGIQLGNITEQQLSDIVKSFGELVLAPSDEATVSALIGGIIKDIHVMEGDYVRKGEIIARIVHPDIVDMQQDYLDARNQNEYLKTEYLRQKRLLEDSVNAQKTVQSARAIFQSNRARKQSLKKKLQLIHINPENLTPENIQDAYTLKAPISGYVAQVEINTGNHITPQQSLFHITANEKAHIDLKVYEKDINKIVPGQRITFTLANNPMEQTLEGEVMKMGKRFDTEQRTAIVHAGIKEIKDNMLPGMSVVAYIQTGGEMHSTLPGAAIVSDEGKNYVFILKREGEVEEKHTGEKIHAHQDEKEHELHSGEEGHSHQHEERYDKHAEEAHAEGRHFYVFEKVQVNTEINQAGFSGFSADIENMDKARFALSNAQAILSEMKKGSSGHGGHAH
ncbi:MAG: efflux RND transporter periplasmic adaptor subunit [Bacteroidales bacterium]|nr:efflux RND transporter periplasmic adaptor subunit [Bacteroidales bacterium]